MLIGLLLSFTYGLCHGLWLGNSTSKLAMVQFYTHQAGTAVILVSLFLLFGQFVDAATIDPLLAISSITVFIALILKKIEFVRSMKKHVGAKCE